MPETNKPWVLNPHDSDRLVVFYHTSVYHSNEAMKLIVHRQHRFQFLVFGLWQTERQTDGLTACNRFVSSEESWLIRLSRNDILFILIISPSLFYKHQQNTKVQIKYQHMYPPWTLSAILLYQESAAALVYSSQLVSISEISFIIQACSRPIVAP